MQGIELSRKYYEAYGKEMIASKFSEYENRIAVGISGTGSDCLGFDDEISRDHDFGAGFCLWLNDEDYEKIGLSLAREYNRLPSEFEGIKKAEAPAYGFSKYGVKKIGDFFAPLIGSPDLPNTNMQWLSIPDYYLAAATSGEVFRDDSGEFSKIRNGLLLNMPEDVRLKKISARVIGMAQSGQYNFNRCSAHGEYGAAALALSEFVKETAALIYLLNGSYCPFYKWAIKGIGALSEFSFMKAELNFLLCSALNENTAKELSEKIEKICQCFADYFRKEHFSQSGDNFLEPHAYEIREKIKDSALRNLHIMEG